MPTFVCKRYRRSAPSATTGTLMDELSFSASSALEAEAKVRRGLLSPAFGMMDWEKYFANLDDELGHELAVWHHGVLHA